MINSFPLEPEVLAAHACFCSAHPRFPLSAHAPWGTLSPFVQPAAPHRQRGAATHGDRGHQAYEG